MNTGLVFAILSMIVLLSSQSETCQLADFLLIKGGQSILKLVNMKSLIAILIAEVELLLEIAV